MNIEAWIFKEDEKKKKEKSEKEKTFERKRKIELSKKIEISKNCEKSEKELNKLKNLLDNWKLDSSTQDLIEKVMDSDIIWEEEIKQIFEKIDEIENNNDVSTYLPEESRITKDEYIQSLTDDIVRTKILVKLNTALTILANYISPDSSMWLNLFSGFIAVLDKNLIKIQENNIDIKKSLEKVEEYRNPKKKLSIWEKIKNFFNELIK